MSPIKVPRGHQTGKLSYFVSQHRYRVVFEVHNAQPFAIWTGRTADDALTIGREGRKEILVRTRGDEAKPRSIRVDDADLIFACRGIHRFSPPSNELKPPIPKMIRKVHNRNAYSVAARAVLHRQDGAEAGLAVDNALICLWSFGQRISFDHGFHFSLGHEVERFV